jgi:hypothetical protein
MTEKNYVINVKTKLGTIFTVRADTAGELNQRVSDVITSQTNTYVLALEQLINGGVPTPIVPSQAPPAPAVVTAPAPTSNPVDTVVAAFGGEVLGTSPTPVVVTPVYEPAPQHQHAQQVEGNVAPVCRHGQMSWVAPANKPWKGWFCPQPKEATDKCSPQFVKG